MYPSGQKTQTHKIGRAFARPFTSVYSVVRLTCTPYPCATGLPGPCYHLQQDGGPCDDCLSVFRLSYQTTAVYWCSVLRTFCCLYSRRALQCFLAEQPPLKDSHWSVLSFLRLRRLFCIYRLLFVLRITSSDTVPVAYFFLLSILYTCKYNCAIAIMFLYVFYCEPQKMRLTLFAALVFKRLEL